MSAFFAASYPRIRKTRSPGPRSDFACLASLADAGCSHCGCSSRAGRRTAAHRKPLGKIPACEALWAKAKRAGPDAEEGADRDYRACFNARASKERFLAGLTEEAQTLVDRLAGE
jgi:hypothetical protein